MRSSPMSKPGVLRNVPNQPGVPPIRCCRIRRGTAMQQTWKMRFLIGLLLFATCRLAIADESASKPQAPQRSIELDDPLEPLSPLKGRSGRDDDRIRALAWFTSARVAEQNQDYPRALRSYQRALRFDPDALAALREIVPLAF